MPLVADEDYQRRFGVSPREIAERLVDRFEQTLRAGPELALGDEHVLALVTDQDVRFPNVVEGLTGYVCEVRSQDHDEVVS